MLRWYGLYSEFTKEYDSELIQKLITRLELGLCGEEETRIQKYTDKYPRKDLDKMFKKLNSEGKFMKG